MGPPIEDGSVTLAAPSEPLRVGRRGRFGPTAAEAAAIQRGRLHAALLAALDEHGYQSLRARELCERASVSTRDLYRHYRGGVHECFIDCAEEVAAAVVELVTRASLRGEAPKERLFYAIDAFAGLLALEPTAARLVLCEPVAVGPTAVRAMRQAEKRMREAFVAELDDAASAQAEALASVVIGGLIAVAQARLLTGRHAEMPALSRELAHWAACCLSCCLQQASAPIARRVDFNEDLVSAAAQLRAGAALVKPSEILRERAASRSATERVAVLAAVVSLFEDRDCRDVTALELSAAAGLSGRRFRELFASKHVAVVCALEALWTIALRAASDASLSVDPTAATVSDPTTATVCLIHSLASDLPFARITFSELPAAAGAQGLRVRMRLIGLAARLLVARPTQHDLILSGASEMLDVEACEASKPLRGGRRGSFVSATAEATAAGAWRLISACAQQGKARDLSETVERVCVLLQALDASDPQHCR